MKSYHKRVSAKLRHYKKLKGCENCGYNENGLALDFAHKDPTEKSYYIYKDGPTGSGMGKLVSRLTIGINIAKNKQRWIELKQEIRKCKVLCKNCHVVETYTNKEMHNGHKMWKSRRTNYIEPEKENTLEDLFS